MAIVISLIPAALTKSTACDKLSPAQLGMAAGSAGGNACADHRTVLERVVGIRLDCRDYYWPGVLAKIYRKAENQKQRKELGLIVTLTFFSMLFWAFAQQGVARLAFISTASLTAICLVIPFRLLCSSRLMPSQLCCAVCSGVGG